MILLFISMIISIKSGSSKITEQESEESDFDKVKDRVVLGNNFSKSKVYMKNESSDEEEEKKEYKEEVKINNIKTQDTARAKA